MKKAEIKVGGLYTARVSGRHVTVRVDAIDSVRSCEREMTYYRVTNMSTGRKTTFYSAAKFRAEVTTDQAKKEYEQRTATVQTAEDQSVTDPTSFGLAARIAALPLVSTTPGRKLTDEQYAIIQAAPTTQVLVIEAGAGCGKTSTLVETASNMPGIGQYTAFNTSLVAESKNKFPSRVRCNTIHSLAFGAEGRKHAHRLNGNRVRSSEVAAMLGLGALTIDGPDGKPKTLPGGVLASSIIRGLRSFCQSADKEITARHLPRLTGIDAEGSRDNSDRVRAHLLPFAQKFWADKCDPNGQLPFTHDDYVKMWEMGGSCVIQADYVLLDEAQDTSPVMLSIMAQQVARGTRCILVGDSAQQIYSWRGAINALAAFPDAPRMMLSQSFRFGPVVAAVANAILSHLEERTPLVMRGFDPIKSRLGTLSEPDCVLTRTNACAVSYLIEAFKVGKRAHLIGGGTDVVSFVQAAVDLQQGRRTAHPELCCFEDWKEVQAYAKTEEGEDLRLMVKLVDSFGADVILSALRRMPDEKSADIVLSTAHKSKGREWKRVKLAGDFLPLEKMGDEEVRLLYVAATRAQHMLDVSECPPFCGGQKRANEGWNGEGGQLRTVDLSEAKRLSASIPADAPAVGAEQRPDPTDSPHAVGAAQAPERAGFSAAGGAVHNQTNRPAPTENTWAKGRNGDWLVRGKAGQSGSVEVVKKNGQRSRVTIKRVVWTDDTTALYEV